MSINKKERFVTRTISSSIVTVKCYDRNNKDFENITKCFSGKVELPADEMEIFSAFDTMRYRAVEIIESRIIEMRYKISEADFIRYGKPILDGEIVSEEEA